MAKRVTLSDGRKLTVLDALAWLALRDLQSSHRVELEWFVSRWRRYLASNLELKEWKAKGWRTARCYSLGRESLRRLVECGALDSLSGLRLTAYGLARADEIRRCFKEAMDGAAFVAYCRATYEKATGKFAA